MGFIKNLFRYEKIEKLKAGYAIGMRRNHYTKDLLYKGEVVETNIDGVSNNLHRNVDGENVSLFLVKDGDDYIIYDRVGNKVLPSLNDAVNEGIVEKEVIDFGLGVKQYIMKDSSGYVIMVPQQGYVSDGFKFISVPDEFGRRRVTESDLIAKLKRNSETMSYYINAIGERVSPEFVSMVDAGKYVILYAQNSEGKLEDYICDKKDFNNMSYGYNVIKYVRGKFFASSGFGTCFLIDEQGHKVSSNLSKYWVLDNGVVVAENDFGVNTNIYTNDYKVDSIIHSATVSSKTGVVLGKIKNGEEFEFVMFGLDLSKKYPVNANCAELVVKMLDGSISMADYMDVSAVGLTKEEIEQTISVYEQIMKDNLQISPDNEFCKVLSTNARETFLKELNALMALRVRAVRKGLKDTDKERFKQVKLLKGHISQRKLIEEMLEEKSNEFG